MRRILAVLIVVVAAIAVFADSKTETIEQLKARAEQAKPADQVKLFMEIAQRQLAAADKAYQAGDADTGKVAIADVASYGERAGKAAVETGKRLKHTEIDLRKITDRLEGIRRSLSVDDRPPLQDASERLEKVRTELLNRMFKGKS